MSNKQTMASKAKFVSGNKAFDLMHTQNELEKKKKTYNSVNLSKLPDRGKRLKEQIDELENLLTSLTLEADDVRNVVEKELNPIVNSAEGVCKTEKECCKDDCKENLNCKNLFSKNPLPFCEISNAPELLSFSDFSLKENTSVKATVMDSPSFKNWRDKGNPSKTILTEPKPLIENLTKMPPNQYRPNIFLPTSEDSVKKMHDALVTYPDETKEEAEPENLKSSLMLHQKRGLAWLTWREEQVPSGGILADDMGLGKTLTMISLILKQKEQLRYLAQNEKYNCRGTLIICLASIIHQWKDEIAKHCEKNALKVLLYHGPKREKNFKRLAEFDIVLTTYNIVMNELKARDKKIESPLFVLKWERIVLDEAHTIKNPQSQTAQAVFSLKAFRKWAVTGTPIHNVFKDLYSLIKFLQFSPFDEYNKFKKLTDECSESSKQRRNLLIKSIVLRRSKDQIDEWGNRLIDMCNKTVLISYIELSAEERKHYDKLKEKITKKFHQYFEKSSKLKSSSSLLVFLLRLQQCCNHLSLLKKEAEDDDISADITDCLSSLKIDDTDAATNSSESNLELTLDELETPSLSDISFKSSKIKELFAELKKISDTSNNSNKSVIVSQWVSMLDIVAYHLKEENMPYHIIAGNTKVEDRQKFTNDFNCNESGAKIMLLSLKAGGVGLNLTGANHLFLLDLHWNPALEMQACDRIHRVDQKKDVVIHKFICRNTIEEKIKSLQDEKHRIARSVLHGTKLNTKCLSIEDFKTLFNIQK